MQLILRVDLTKSPIEVTRDRVYYFEKQYPFYLPSVSPKDVVINEETLLESPSEQVKLKEELPFLFDTSSEKVLLLLPNYYLATRLINDPFLLESTPLIHLEEKKGYIQTEGQKNCWKCQVHQEKNPYSSEHICSFRFCRCFYCRYITIYRARIQ